MSVLITRPEHDTATFYLSKWTEPLIKECKNKGLNYYDLKGKKANQKTFDSFAISKKPEFFILNGHGTENAVYGQNNEPLLSAENIGVIGKNIVYSVACEAARKLGSIIEKTNGIYIGYSQKFIFIVNQNSALRPLRDELAKPFFEATNRVPESIIKGNTVGKAVEKSRETYKKQIVRLRGKAKTFKEELVLKYLLWNLAFLTVKGSMNACCSFK